GHFHGWAQPEPLVPKPPLKDFPGARPLLTGNESMLQEAVERAHVFLTGSTDRQEDVRSKRRGYQLGSRVILAHDSHVHPAFDETFLDVTCVGDIEVHLDARITRDELSEPPGNNVHAWCCTCPDPQAASAKASKLFQGPPSVLH